MTEITPPFALQGGVVTHPALLFRRLLSVISAEGVARFNGANDMKVTENSPAGMSVLVDRGGAYVQGDDVTDQGLYYVYNDASKVLTITAAHASLPRKDIVVAHVKDNFHGQAGDTWLLEVIAGTPAASPSEPTLPASAIKLAVVSVAAADTSITNAEITDSRAYAGAPVGWMKGGSLVGTEPQVNFSTSFDVTDDAANKRANVAFVPTVSKEALYYRHVGTSPFERWYAAGFLGGTITPTALAINFLHAMPFFSTRGGTLDRIAFEVTTAGAAGSVARAGIYNNTSDTNLYPSSLVVDGGEFTTTTTGIKAATISQVLTANTLYWFVYIAGSAAPTIRAFLQADQFPIFGFPATAFSTVQGFLAPSQTYGVLPSTYPAGATPTSGGMPLVAVRFSA